MRSEIWCYFSLIFSFFSWNTYDITLPFDTITSVQLQDNLSGREKGAYILEVRIREVWLYSKMPSITYSLHFYSVFVLLTWPQKLLNIRQLIYACSYVAIIMCVCMYVCMYVCSHVFQLLTIYSTIPAPVTSH